MIFPLDVHMKAGFLAGIHSELCDLWSHAHRSRRLQWDVSKLNPARVFDFFAALPFLWFPSFTLILVPFPDHVFSEVQSYSGAGGTVSPFLSELPGQDFSVRKAFGNGVQLYLLDKGE